MKGRYLVSGLVNMMMSVAMRESFNTADYGRRKAVRPDDRR
jgi:hypothetical protein